MPSESLEAHVRRGSQQQQASSWLGSQTAFIIVVVMRNCQSSCFPWIFHHVILDDSTIFDAHVAGEYANAGKSSRSSALIRSEHDET
jgi:hypothetical protein